MAKLFPIFAFVSFAAVIPVLAQTVAQTEVAHQPIGTLQNGVYHHTRTGLEFTLPPEWAIVSQARSSTPGAQYVKVKNAVTNAMATVWIKRRNANPEDLAALMSGRLDDKTMQRNNFQGYKYRAESVQHTTIGGRPALSAVADYVSVGQKMVEYLTWIDGEKSRVVFVGRVPAAELADFQTRFDPVIQSAVVP
jgi:hypothetical protein